MVYTCSGLPSAGSVVEPVTLSAISCRVQQRARRAKEMNRLISNRFKVSIRMNRLFSDVESWLAFKPPYFVGKDSANERK